MSGKRMSLIQLKKQIQHMFKVSIMDDSIIDFDISGDGVVIIHLIGIAKVYIWDDNNYQIYFEEESN